MSVSRLFNVLVIAVCVAGLLDVAAQVAFSVVFSYESYTLWSANFVLLVVAVCTAVPCACREMLASWETTRSYLV